MEKFNCNLLLSLKDISLRRLTTLLWTQKEILESLKVLNIHYDFEAKLRKLGVPPILRKQMKILVRHVESEIENWRIFHRKYLNIPRENFDVQLLQQLCWTSLGTIDYRETVKRFIRLEVLDIVQRYKLACLYCLEDHIPFLWEQLECSKRYFYEAEGLFNYTMPLLEFCWPYLLNGEESKLDRMLQRDFNDTRNFNRYSFDNSAYSGNKAATEYFLQKLTCDERESALIEIAEAVASRRTFKNILYGSSEKDDFPNEKISDTLCYLLSQMTTEQQTEMFKRQSCDVLICLLDWPWHYHVMGITEFIWTFCEGTNFFNLLESISFQIKHGNYSVNVFQDIFLQSPSNFRNQFVDRECQHMSIFEHLFEIQDSETIKVIFRNLDAADRKRLVFSKSFLHLIYFKLSERNWKLFQLCLQEAALSKEDKAVLRKNFERFLNLVRRISNQKDTEFNPFFQYLDQIS